MKRFLLIYLCAALLLPCAAFAQNYSISGRVTDRQTSEPVEFATVMIEGTGQWAVADAKGNFTIKNIPAGKVTISVACLGYVTDTKEVTLSKDIPVYQIGLNQDNLSLDGAVVTAKENDNSATTSRTIDRTALDHVQVMNVADITSLLPGGATTNNSLTEARQFNIRAGSSESGNASFGTAVEVDGVRLSSNASFGEVSTSTTVKGVNTNNIASSNVESVEVITGVPSVEYGDMTSGVVKINTKKGKTPLMVTLSTSPNTKQVSASKGMGLGTRESGKSRGILNASVEYTKSISKQMSPYSAYDRKQLSMTYSNLLNGGVLADMPIRFSAGVTGNLGGMDTSADPDAVQGTYTIEKDNSVRGNISFDWLLSKSWITNIEFNASAVYSDKLSKDNTYNSSAVNKIVLHGREQGYFTAEPYLGGEVPAVKSIPSGYWFNELCVDDRPLTYKMALKANWSRNFGKLNSKLKLGTDWSGDHNFGIGKYSEDMATAPTFREYRFNEVPWMNNIAAYAEENLMIPVGKDGRINVIAGIRSDNTMIKGSEYGTTSSLSPRFNLKYSVLQPKGRSKKTVRELSFRASHGTAVKLPSFSILFPMPTYRDVNVFNSTTTTTNESMSAYFIEPRTVEYNPDLVWQRNSLNEVGMDIDILGTRISLAAFYNRTLNSYVIENDYDRTSYAYTNIGQLNSCSIPVDNRLFSIDRNTGIVTVSDRTGALPPAQLGYTTYKELAPRYYAANEKNPINRYGVEWVVDFKTIKAVNTSIRIDGTWYSYKGISSNTVYYSPYTLRSAQDNMPFPYIGVYYGGHSASNGSESQMLKTNLTTTTRIPKVRMVISMKLEASLLKYSRTLSEYADGTERAKVITDQSDILSTNGASIYGGDNYNVYYPEYYCTYDDPTQHEYLPALKAARESGNTALFSDLWQLSNRTNYLFNFNKDYISPYFSANFSVTKEIGDIASISFYANNFFNNMAQLYSTKEGKYVSSSSYIPKFYYGLTARFKF